jgi:hypothetical protein
MKMGDANMMQMQPIFEQTYLMSTLNTLVEDISAAFDVAKLGNGRGHYVVTIVRRFDDFTEPNSTHTPKPPLLRA